MGETDSATGAAHPSPIGVFLLPDVSTHTSPKRKRGSDGLMGIPRLRFGLVLSQASSL
jgi:hypothetical protein